MSPDSQINVDRDSELLDQVHMGRMGPTIRIWHNQRCLVVTSREWRLANALGLDREFKNNGWPIVVRTTGGTAVTNGPGVVNLSLVYSEVDQGAFNLARPYLLLCEILGIALSIPDLSLRFGEIEGAFCSGSYDISCDGLKIAGTAQRVRRRQAIDGLHRTILVHLNLLVSEDTDEMSWVINEFYLKVGENRKVKAARATSLSKLLGRHFSTKEVAEEMARNLSAKSILSPCIPLVRITPKS